MYPVKYALQYCLAGLLAITAGAGVAADPADKSSAAVEPFAMPFSFQLNILNSIEYEGLSQFGASGLTEYVVKPVAGMQPGKYETFDESIVMAVNIGKVAPQSLDMVRSLVREQIEKTSYKIQPPEQSQAGIASIFSLFRTWKGDVTTELLVVVFDREKMRGLLKSKPEMRAIDAIFQSSIRAMVSHMYPVTAVDFSGLDKDGTTRDALKILYEKSFSNFMTPTSKELDAPA
ncbi:MAG: hypothetical protein OEY67_09975 [Gammaproteobacteria bacterium]|nr:hypothetical protein [Gammaproteobacteria bacterium]